MEWKCTFCPDIMLNDYNKLFIFIITMPTFHKPHRPIQNPSHDYALKHWRKNFL